MQLLIPFPKYAPMHKVWVCMLAFFNIPPLFSPLYFQCDVYFVCRLGLGRWNGWRENGWLSKPVLDFKKNGFIPFNKEYNCSLLHISIQPSIHPSIQVFCQDIICITHLPHLGKLNLGLTKVHLEVTKFWVSPRYQWGKHQFWWSHSSGKY